MKYVGQTYRQFLSIARYIGHGTGFTRTVGGGRSPTPAGHGGFDSDLSPTRNWESGES